MNKKETSLDERILGLPSDHDYSIIYRDEIYGSFDITERGLLVFEEYLQRITSPIIPHNVAREQVLVVFAGKPSEKYNKVSEMFSLRNPRKGEITGINIRLMTKESLSSLWIDETGLYSSRSIVLLLASNYDSNLGNIRSLVKGELVNIKFWYSPIRNLWDRMLALLNKIPLIVYLCLFLFCFLYSLYNIFSFSIDFTKNMRQERFQQFAQKIIEGPSIDPNKNAVSIKRVRQEETFQEPNQKIIDKPKIDPNTAAAFTDMMMQEQFPQLIQTIIDDPNTDPNTSVALKTVLSIVRFERTQRNVTPVIFIIIYILYFSFMSFVLISCLIFASYLFPRIVFEIGEGKKRHENRIWMVRFLIGSAVFCGIVIPFIVRPLISRWFF